MRTAAKMFSEHPVDEVTVEQIADAAAVSLPSIYNHFGSKLGLYAAVVEQALDVDRRFMDLAYTADRGPAEQLSAAAEQLFNFYLQFPDYFRMLAFPNDPGRYPAGRDVADHLATAVEEQTRRIVTALTKAIEAGISRPIDPEQTATVLWTSICGVISLAWRHDRLQRSEPELRALLAIATDVIANGLLTRPEDTDIS